MTERTARDGKGRFSRNIKTAQRDARAAELKAQGWSLDRIAAELGYASRGHVHDAIDRAFKAIPTEETQRAKQLDLERIDRLIEKAWEIMLRDHLTVSQGKVVGRRTGWERDDEGGILRDGEGAPIPLYEDILDDGPALAAIREIRGLLERRAKITGYDAPLRSRVEVITEDVFDAKLAELEAQVAANDAAAAGAPGEGAAI